MDVKYDLHLALLSNIIAFFLVQIENIKKCNKLFTDDNNHLRSRATILIPIESKTVVVHSFTPNCSSQPDSTPSTKLTHSQSQNFSREAHTSKLNLPNQSNSLCESSEHAKPNESITDFLLRIDSSIATTKTKIEKVAQRIENGSIEEEIHKNNSKKFSEPKLSLQDNAIHQSSSSSTLFPFTSNRDSVRIASGNKRKTKSMKSFEKKQEEIFEL